MPPSSPNTRDSLVDAAIQEFSSNPATSLADVAAAAGVTRVTLHRLFGSREELLREVAIRALRDMDIACHKAADGARSYTSALHLIVEALVPVGDRFHFLWTRQDVWSDEIVKKQVAKDDAELSKLIDHAKAEGGIAQDIPNAWILAAIDAVVFAGLTASRKGDIAVNDAGRLAAKTLFDGIAKRSKPKPSRLKMSIINIFGKRG